MNALGIILAGGKNKNLGMLTKLRATSAVPVGSCYRAIDFPLSNMTNSGIGKVAVMTQYNSRSLNDHLSSSKWWDMGRKNGGLFVFTPFLSNDSTQMFRGTADAIYQNLTFLRRSKEKYVVISSGDCVYKMDYNDMLAHHIKTEAEITIAYRHVPDDDIKKYGVMTLDENERLIDIEEKPLEPQSQFASIGVYIIERKLLITMMKEIADDGRYDLVRDLFSRYRKKLKIYGYKFDGYWRNLGSLRSYFTCNMEFLQKEVRDTFILNAPHIHTKPKDEPPAKFNSGASITNCLVGGGTILDGDAFRSIIFRNVYVGENSNVRNCIIMEGTRVENNCTVEYAILDKDVILLDGAEIIGTPDNIRIVEKGSVVAGS